MDRRPILVVLQVLCAALLAATAHAACAEQPAVIENGYWECEGTADGGMCSATCNTGTMDQRFMVSRVTKIHMVLTHMHCAVFGADSLW
jgi:hypothetical protein